MTNHVKGLWCGFPFLIPGKTISELGNLISELGERVSKLGNHISEKGETVF